MDGFSSSDDLEELIQETLTGRKGTSIGCNFQFDCDWDPLGGLEDVGCACRPADNSMKKWVVSKALAYAKEVVRMALGSINGRQNFGRASLKQLTLSAFQYGLNVFRRLLPYAAVNDR
jgi:hypothetical protein